MIRPRYLLIALVLLLSAASCEKDVENKAPVVDAGPSQTITLPDSAKVKGTVTDDGRIVANLWSQIAGPNRANILNPGADSTVIIFSVPGNYSFQLLSTDNEGAVGADTVSILVNRINIDTFTLTLQPVNNPWEVNLAAIRPTSSPDVDQTYVPTYDLPVMLWTKPNNDWYEVRPMIKFDLSALPANQTIISANLYLYSYPGTTLNGTPANTGPQNGFYAKMIISDWSPATVNWNNQPAASSVIYAPSWDTKEAQLDLNFSVKDAIYYMNYNKVNYGFMLQMANNNPFNNSRTFVSSHNPDPSLAAKFPKLVVVYTKAN